MYIMKYYFDQYDRIIATYLEVLANKSSTRLQEQKRKGEIKNVNHDSEVLASCIENVEEYLYYNYTKHPQNFNYILNSLLNKATIIAVLPDNSRGIYGKTENSSKTIYINPDLPGRRGLTKEERTRLYMAHELGHAVNSGWMKKVIEYCDKNIRQGKLTKENAQLIYDGFSMLDESTTQDRAEDFAYNIANKQRPKLAYYKNNRLFGGEPYKSNFDFYGELQEPAVMFARTLRGIGKEDDDNKALRMISDRALSENFFDNILKEYNRDGQIQFFEKEVQYMGLLKRASYANFGYGSAEYLKRSASYLQSLKSITGKLRYRRNPFNDDIDV